MNSSLSRFALRAAPALLAVALFSAPLAAQQKMPSPGAGAQVDQQLIQKGQRAFPAFWRPYTPVQVPEPVLTNSPTVDQLVVNGQMRLSLQDAISLALENNLDIQVQRYIPWIADTDVLRTRSGGAGRGLAGTGTASALGSIPSSSLDPELSASYLWQRSSFPINNPFLSGGGLTQDALTNYTSRTNLSYSQGFITGTAYSVSFQANRQSTTSASTFLNPSVNTSLFFTVTQQLLNGFGTLPNTRFIKIAVNNKRSADLTFANQVITTVSSVQQQYWDLVFAVKDLEVKKRSVQLAEKLYNDNKRQVEIGTLAPIEVVRAESEVARTRQDLIVAQTLLLQNQMVLKNSITRNPRAGALLDVQIVPVDEPSTAQVAVEPIQQAINEAFEKRPDIRQARIGLENNELNVKATKNALLPILTLVGQYGSQGLAGNGSSIVTNPTGLFTADTDTPLVDANGNPVQVAGVPVFAGVPVIDTVVTPFAAGFPTSLRTVFAQDFPTYSISFNLSIPIRNRSAQADAARALLEQRQAETSYQALQNNILVEVRNAQIAVEQSQARVEAAIKARQLAERTLDAEQKKYQLGASTIFLVIQAQRDLAQAESTEVGSIIDLTKARVDYERSLGRTLEVNHVELPIAQNQGAPDNFNSRVPQIPGTRLNGEIVSSDPLKR